MPAPITLSSKTKRFQGLKRCSTERYALHCNSVLSDLVLTAPASGQLDKILGGLGNRGNPSDSKTANGLKEALRIGTDHAVDLTGTANGFFSNEAIKILMPEKLRTAEKGLRLAGLGGKIEEFELSMNRAAEKATPAAGAFSRRP